jgi:hypothetical protein
MHNATSHAQARAAGDALAQITQLRTASDAKVQAEQLIQIRRFFVCHHHGSATVRDGWRPPARLCGMFVPGRHRPWPHLRTARGPAAGYRDGRPGASG